METSENVISSILAEQRKFFASNETKKVEFRLEQLRKFKSVVEKYEKKIADALWADLHKSYEEAYLTEISIVKMEIESHIRHLRKWAKPKRVSTPLHVLPSSSKIYYEPLGVSLIVAPWNYPFQLLMNPLVGSISAGNCAVIKPSPYSENISGVMEEMITETFSREYIACVQGGRSTNEILFSKRFDVIFFTGSPALGKVVMKAASESLTPVILELGGKSPCIVEKDADLDIAAKRIAWGKTINAGQTCIAPDYILAHSIIKERLIEKTGEKIEEMFGKDIKSSKYFPRIINEQAFERITGYLKCGDIAFGGDTDRDERFISPTILVNVDKDSDVMRDEIFGPVLPVLTFEEIGEAIDFINSREKPLAFYYFGDEEKAKDVLSRTTSGGGCINDTLMHITNHNLPFGGVGNSGLGKYHGRDSFLAFSNQRSVVSTPVWIDLPVKYAPFKFFEWVKKIV